MGLGGLPRKVKMLVVKKLLWLLPIPLAAVGWWAYHRSSDPPQVPFAKVIRETLVSTLPTNGKVEPIEWQPVRVAVSYTHLAPTAYRCAAGAVVHELLLPRRLWRDGGRYIRMGRRALLRVARA